MKKLIQTLHYCKADKHTGKPIIVTDGVSQKRKKVGKWSMTLYDEQGDPVLLRMQFNNATGMASRQGATTVLQIWK